MNQAERARLKSLIVTGNEPHGGATMILDRGEGVSGDRYICVEIPLDALPRFIEALVKVRNEQLS